MKEERNNLISSLHVHVNTEFLENSKREKLENIKTQLATFILDNYEYLEENDIVNYLRDAYDAIRFAIMDS